MPSTKDVFTTFPLVIAVMMFLLSAQKNVLPQSGKTTVRQAAATYVFIFLIISQGIYLVNCALTIKWASTKKRPAATAAGLDLFYDFFAVRLTEGRSSVTDRFIGINTQPHR